MVKFDAWPRRGCQTNGVPPAPVGYRGQCKFRHQSEVVCCGTVAHANSSLQPILQLHNTPDATEEEQNYTERVAKSDR